jgi:hypothetical protein
MYGVWDPSTSGCSAPSGLWGIGMVSCNVTAGGGRSLQIAHGWPPISCSIPLFESTPRFCKGALSRRCALVFRLPRVSSVLDAHSLQAIRHRQSKLQLVPYAPSTRQGEPLPAAFRSR